MLPCYLILGSAGFSGKTRDLLFSTRFSGPLPPMFSLPRPEPVLLSRLLKAQAGRSVRILCFSPVPEISSLAELCRRSGCCSFLLLDRFPGSGFRELLPGPGMAFTRVLLAAQLLGPGTEGSWCGQLLRHHLQGTLQICPRGSCEFLDIRDLGQTLREILDSGSSGCRVLRGRECSLSALLAMVRPLKRHPPVLLSPDLLLRFSPAEPVRSACLRILTEPLPGSTNSPGNTASRRSLQSSVRDMLPLLLTEPNLPKKY